MQILATANARNTVNQQPHGVPQHLPVVRPPAPNTVFSPVHIGYASVGKYHGVVVWWPSTGHQYVYGGLVSNQQAKRVAQWVAGHYHNATVGAL